MDFVTFLKEDRKYSSLWKADYKDANWKRLASVVLKKVDSRDGISLVDFGFGRGLALDFFEKKGFNVSGVEISSYCVNNQLCRNRKTYHASLDNLGVFGDNQFDVGFCNDVLEHIPEYLVVPSLEEMARVCSDKLFLSICPENSHHKSLNGEGLHLTVRPENFWTDLLGNYGSVERIKFLFGRSIRYVVDLK